MPERLARLLGGTLTHLREKRGGARPSKHRKSAPAAPGKPSVGVIRLGAIATSGARLEPTIFVEDDGRGFEDNALLAATHGRVLESSDAADGSFRTAPPDTTDELAGRGMGLSAVVRELASVGFALRLDALASGGTRVSLVPRASAAGARLGAVS